MPRLLADLPEQNAYATEFVAGESLEDLANAKGADIVKLYVPALDVLKRIWSIPADAKDAPEFEPPFGPDLYRWERELFENECVKGRYGMDAIPDDARCEMEGVAEALSGEPVVLVHRDFQSSNLLYRDGANGGPLLIDYQGMRRGPAAYDLASLLYDPYVSIDATDRNLLLELAAKFPSAPSSRMVTLAAVQRLGQALGAYCRLAAAGQTRFTKYLLRALGNFHHAVHDAGRPALAAFSHSLIEREKLAGR